MPGLRCILWEYELRLYRKKEEISRQIFMKMFSWDALREHHSVAVKHIQQRRMREKKIKRKFELTDSEVCLIFLIKFIHYVLTLDYKRNIGLSVNLISSNMLHT
jgi:hypothetical protein